MNGIQSCSTRPRFGPSQLAQRVHQTLPQGFQRHALALGLNLTFSQALREGRLDFLRGRHARIAVSDIALDFSVTVVGERLQVMMRPTVFDVSFRAELHSLLEIIAGKADPDTLFFHRKLVIEGDTDLGLTLKNFLDSQDPVQLTPPLLYRFLSRLVNE